MYFRFRNYVFLVSLGSLEPQRVACIIQMFIIVELLRTKGKQAWPHTLENLVTHRSKTIWLSCDCLYVHPYVHLYANIVKNKRVAEK